MKVCSIEGCGAKHYGLGWCAKHYARLRTTGICAIALCGRRIYQRGWCRKHYERWSAHGNPLKTIFTRDRAASGSLRDWLTKHVGYTGDSCLIWPFARMPNGRAHMKDAVPSRVMCELVHGKPPSGEHEAAHSCGKAHLGCVHPHHLRWATHAENEADKEIHGTVAWGKRLPQSKLTEADVHAIRAMRGQKLQREIACEFGVDITCINKIFRGRRWGRL